MLLVHVADAHLVHGAELGGVLEYRARRQRMDVDADRRFVTDDDE